MKQILISAIWALNCWYIAGFAHALAGMPDVGPVVGLAAFLTAMLVLRLGSRARRDRVEQATA